jgi:D-tyrosyl-tRNA(Tyr) deacylase
MKFVIQRVREAKVDVDNKTIGNIGHGLLVLVGISGSDDERIADKMVDKMTKLRIFDDDEGKTNLSISDVGGEFLIISQFTLYADCKKGNRPSFINAGKPDMANGLYEYIISEVAKKGFKTEHGMFGADMKVSLVNDGPFTIVLDSEEIM